MSCTPPAALDALLEWLKGAGLTGMETYYQDYDAGEVEMFRGICERYELLPLGGSDFHGLGGPETARTRRHPATDRAG